MGGYAWVTLATNDAYSLGALVLAHSLRRVNTVHELAVLVTPGVTETMREKLSTVFSVVMEVNVLDSKDEANLALLARPELGITFTKLHCWRLTQYEKCVFLDADTLVVRNCDELFEREELSAAPDVGWPDCFNSGVFVYKPCQQTFASITSFAAAKGSFDGGDQGLLNMYFSDWARKDISKHLPFIYNMCSTATYSYLPAFKQFGEDVRIIHFIGITKPWLQYFDTLTGIVQPPMGSAHLQPLLQLWWNIFCEKVHPHLSPVMAGLAGALAQMTLGEPRSAAQVALEEHMRKQSWEQGQIDYMGRDSFDNIWKKICETLALAPPRLPSPPKETEKPAKTPTDETAEPTESIESAEPAKVTQPIEAVDEVDKGTAQATTSHTEEQSLVNNVPITNNDNIISKLSEKGKQVVDITSAETNENKQPESGEVTEDITQESSTKSETVALDTIVDPSPAQPSMQASPEKIIEEPNASSLLKEASKETAEIVVEELCAGSLLVEAAQETIEKVVEELGTGSLLKEALQETTPPRVPTDSVQSCSIEQRKDDESPCSKESAIFAAQTEQLASNVTDIIDLLIAVDVEQPKSSDIKDEKYAKELTTASEVLTISPVPIQVAESVLQLEPKESVSDSQAVTEQVLSSTITPVHESAVPCSETLIDTGNKIQVNGSAPGIVSAESEEKSSRVTTEAVESIDDAATKLSESSTPSTETLQVLPPTEEPLVTETSALPSSITKSTETSEARVDKTLQQTTESDQQTKETASCTKETKETKESPPPECAVTESSPSSESPVRPSRAKELNVPSTSAPETPTQESKDQEKVTKKAARKSIDKSASEGEPGETTEADSTGKKVVKKVVKKVTKKPKSKPEEALDDGAQDSSSSANKPKKTVKVTKKGSKSLQTPDTPDAAAVSETPSSSTSDTPVPPKRKSKAPPTKPAVKKPDVE